MPEEFKVACQRCTFTAIETPTSWAKRRKHMGKAKCPFCVTYFSVIISDELYRVNVKDQEYYKNYHKQYPDGR
jgi:hypothetical protein